MGPGSLVPLSPRRPHPPHHPPQIRLGGEEAAHSRGDGTGGGCQGSFAFLFARLISSPQHGLVRKPFFRSVLNVTDLVIVIWQYAQTSERWMAMLRIPRLFTMGSADVKTTVSFKLLCGAIVASLGGTLFVVVFILFQVHVQAGAVCGEHGWQRQALHCGRRRSVNKALEKWKAGTPRNMHATPVSTIVRTTSAATAGGVSDAVRAVWCVY